MKIVAINGSPRKEGNTFLMLKELCKTLNELNIETEILHLGTVPLSGCIGCGKCYVDKNLKCVLSDNLFNSIFAKMATADGIVIGSPVYFGDMTANMKAFIERAGMLTRANNNVLARKPAAAVVAVRRGGAVNTFSNMNLFFTISQMIVVGSSYWNMGIAREIGEFEKDDEGHMTMKTLGDNMAWLLGKINK